MPDQERDQRRQATPSAALVRAGGGVEVRTGRGVVVKLEEVWWSGREGVWWSGLLRSELQLPLISQMGTLRPREGMGPSPGHPVSQRQSGP